MGEYADLISAFSAELKYPYSYLNDKWSDIGSWQAEVRAILRGMMAYSPAALPLDVKSEGTYEIDGVVNEHISYAQPFGPRTEGIFLKPAGISGKLPGIIALHDHGGFKYFGKEKITAVKVEHPILKGFKEQYYGGRSWATELAKRGYCVFVPDVFLWGSRKQTYERLPEYIEQRSGGHPKDSTEYIEMYNGFAGDHESMVAKSLFLSGTTWPGVMVWDDMRAVDYLTSRPEVDTSRIGCGGLSGGGNRSIFLTAMDERINVSFCAGFMCSFNETAKHRIQCHTWMFHLPGLAKMMDLHDVYSLHGARPTMVLYDEEDSLWTSAGQHESDKQLKKIYAKMGVPEFYRGNFYPGDHKFDIEMQEDAFNFLGEHLK